jgi:hypothetical protein
MLTAEGWEVGKQANRLARQRLVKEAPEAVDALLKDAAYESSPTANDR